MYIPSSEFYNSDGDQLSPEYQDQKIWDLVGCAPFIIAIKDAIKKHSSEWFGSLDSFELLCKALVVAERETYDRLAKAERPPSEIAAEWMPRPDETSSTPMRWYSDGMESTTPDPTGV